MKGKIFPKGLFKNPVFYLIVTLLLVMGLFGSGEVREDKDGIFQKEFFEDLFSFSEEKVFFFSQKDFSGPESFELSITGENSLISVSSPQTIYSQVLGAGSVNEFDPELSQEIKEYVVQKGDSLSGIANRFGVSVDTIRWANEIVGDGIRSGQRLIILPVDGVLHLVEEQDTVGNLENTYNVESSALPEDLYIGDILVISGGEMPREKQHFVQATVSPGQFIVPAKGTITQGLHPFNAVDIANSCGSPIYAVERGTIQRTGYSAIGGNYIRIIHPGNIVTYYGHLSKIYVTPGQEVSQGSIIGAMGNTGYTIGRTGCHIHFEVRGGLNPFGAYRVGHIFR